MDKKCAYCGKERPINELKKGNIHYIGRDGAGRKASLTKTNYYCHDKPCHGFDQMGHEG